MITILPALFAGMIAGVIVGLPSVSAGTVTFHLETQARFDHTRLDVDLNLRLDATETVGPAEVSLHFEGTERSLGHLPLWRSGQSEHFHVSLQDPTFQSVGAHLLPLRIRWLSLSGRRHTSFVVARATRRAPNPVEFEVSIAPLVISNGSSGTASLKITNRSHQPYDFRLLTLAPDGLQITPEKIVFRVPPHDARTFEFTATVLAPPPSETYENLILVEYASGSHRLAAEGIPWQVRLSPVIRPGEWLFSASVSFSIFIGLSILAATTTLYSGWRSKSALPAGSGA